MAEVATGTKGSPHPGKRPPVAQQAIAQFHEVEARVWSESCELLVIVSDDRPPQATFSTSVQLDSPSSSSMTRRWLRIYSIAAREYTLTVRATSLLLKSSVVAWTWDS